VTKQGENFSESEWAALTPEQQTEALRIEREVDAFLVDSRAIRYIESDANQAALLNFLAEHNLEVNHPSLIFAYDSLCVEGALQLIPLVAPLPPTPVPTQPPARIPTAPDPRAPQMFRNGRLIAFSNPRPL